MVLFPADIFLIMPVGRFNNCLTFGVYQSSSIGLQSFSHSLPVLNSSIDTNLSIFTFRASRFQLTISTTLAYEQRNRHPIFSCNHSLTFHFPSSRAHPISPLILRKLLLSEEMVFGVLLLVVTIGKIILFFTPLDFNKTLKITKTAVSHHSLKLSTGILFCLIDQRQKMMPMIEGFCCCLNSHCNPMFPIHRTLVVIAWQLCTIFVVHYFCLIIGEVYVIRFIHSIYYLLVLI